MSRSRPDDPARTRAQWMRARLHRRRARAAAWAVVLFAAAVVGAAVIPASTEVDETLGESLGPTIRETGERPTGYEVTFRYSAPDAESVAIVGDVYFTDPARIGADMSHEARTGDEWREGDVPHSLVTGSPAQLSRGPDGAWVITMVLPAGVHSYGFVEGECETAVLCDAVHDPANPPVLADAPDGSRQSLSQLFVPGHPDFPTYDTDHHRPVSDQSFAGEVRHVTYSSDLSSRPEGEHPLGVYLPAGWDPERAEPYPLLVLSHGAYENETSWFSQGAAANILDHAIADGSMPPAVVVTTLFEDLTDASMGEPAFFDAYAAELRDSVLPYVEREFHVSPERDDRAFGGLSMGGALGLSLLVDHPDLFGGYGLWSAAADLGGGGVAEPSEDELARMSQARAIHMGTGVHDALAGIGESSQERAALYADLGLPVVTHDVDGGHTWHVWRQQLDHFVRGAAFGEAASGPGHGSVPGLEREWGWIAVLVLAVAVAGGAIVAVRRAA